MFALKFIPDTQSCALPPLPPSTAGAGVVREIEGWVVHAPACNCFGLTILDVQSGRFNHALQLYFDVQGVSRGRFGDGTSFIYKTVDGAVFGTGYNDSVRGFFGFAFRFVRDCHQLHFFEGLFFLSLVVGRHRGVCGGHKTMFQIVPGSLHGIRQDIVRLSNKGEHGLMVFCGSR